jgi:hypothetical protein
MTTPDGKLENTKYAAVTGAAAAAYQASRGTSTLRYARYGCECHLLEANEPPKPDAGEEGGGPERKASDDRVQFTGNYVAGRFRLGPKLQWQRHSLAEVSDELGPGGAPTGVETEVFNLLLNTTTADLLLHHGEEGQVHGTLGITGEYQTSDSRGIIPLVPDARLTAGGVFGFEQVDLGRVSIVAGARGANPCTPMRTRTSAWRISRGTRARFRATSVSSHPGRPRADRERRACLALTNAFRAVRQRPALRGALRDR